MSNHAHKTSCKVKTTSKVAMAADTKAKSHSVLFLCWGNICRSPMAEAIFKNLLKERGISDRWTVDSAGTGEWNTGDLPDPRTLKTLRNHGLDSQHIARVIEKKDFEKFEFIICFDHKNVRDATDMGPKGTEERLILLGKLDPQGTSDVMEDPYYRNEKDFETTFHTCVRACKVFLDSVEYDYV